MQHATQTLSVNAAFLAEIKEENRELGVLLAQCRHWLADRVAWPNHAAEIALLLDRLRDQVAFHFSLEEAFGYMEGCLEAAPQHSDRAARLRGEHGPLYQEIVSIGAAAARVVLQRGDTLVLIVVADRLAQFCARLKLHEENEGDLILDAFASDLGVGD